MRFIFDRASLIVGSKFTNFDLFYVVFEGNFPSISPWGAYIWRGDLTEGFFALRVHGGAYVRNFMVISHYSTSQSDIKNYADQGRVGAGGGGVGCGRGG